MQVRVMKEGRSGNKTNTLYSCSHVVETPSIDGLKIELINPDGKIGKRKVIRMPRDGAIVYYMDQGKTIDKRVWPPKVSGRK